MTGTSRRRNYSPWASWMLRLERTEHCDPMPVDSTPLDLDALLAWRERCGERLSSLLGALPEPVPADLDTLESVEHEGYRMDKVVFDTEETMSVPSYLLVPDDRAEPGPAVLAVHGHGAGKAEVCGLVASGSPNGDYAAQLAKRGYVVLAPDLRCFGERTDWNPPDHYACDTNLVHALMAAWNPLSQNLWDLARSLDVLEAHPLVDPRRIGVVGLSYGGTMALFLSAWDQRIAAAVVSGYFSSVAESHRVPWNMCGSQVLPGMLGRIEHLDLGALVAPRPLLVETGSEDILFPLAAASDAVGKLGLLYRQLGADDRLVHDVFDGGHQWHGTLAYPFLVHWLGAPAAAV
ncbi:MAG TPA: alpha/beta fold hydrolase [Acidimicrobiales bacterium]